MRISKRRTQRHGEPNQNLLSGVSSTWRSRFSVSFKVCFRSSIGLAYREPPLKIDAKSRMIATVIATAPRTKATINDTSPEIILKEVSFQILSLPRPMNLLRFQLLEFLSLGVQVFRPSAT